MKRILTISIISFLLHGCVEEILLEKRTPGNQHIVVTDDTLICISSFFGKLYLINGLSETSDSAKWDVVTSNLDDAYLEELNDTLSIRSSSLLIDTGIVRLTNYFNGDSITLEVRMVECFQTLYHPNGFTPNGDGINDTWRPIFTNVSELYWTIRSDQGTVIFENNGDLEAEWDGTWNGNPAPSGLYPYQIVYTTIYPEEQIEYNGWLQLNRDQ